MEANEGKANGVKEMESVYRRKETQRKQRRKTRSSRHLGVTGSHGVNGGDVGGDCDSGGGGSGGSWGGGDKRRSGGDRAGGWWRW